MKTKLSSEILNLHNTTLRYANQDWRIIAHQLGTRVLADAEPLHGGERINLMTTRSPLGLGLRQRLNIQVGA